MALDKNFHQIIIGGLQRSGTSLIRGVIGSHPDISIVQYDVLLWVKFYPRIKNRKLSKKEAWGLIQEILSHKKLKNDDITFNLQEFKKWIDHKKERITFKEIYVFFMQYYQIQTKRKNIGLKTPYNEFYTEAIFKLFPETRFIHILRHPLDAASSLKEAKRKWWGGKINYYKHIREWKQSASIAQRNIKKYPGKYLVLKYEDFVSNPEKHTRKICEFLSITFNEEMLKMSGHPGWKGTNSSFAKEKNTDNIGSNSVNKFEQKVPGNIQKKYFTILSKQLKEFDYKTKSISGGWYVKSSYALNSILISLQKYLVNKILVIYYRVKFL